MDTTRRDFFGATAAVAGGLATALSPIAGAEAADAPRKNLDTAGGPPSGGAKLRALLQKPGVIVAAQTPTPQFAAIAEHVGLECGYLGGSFMANMHHLLNDYNLLSPTEMADIVGPIAKAVQMPIICDIDQAGETPLNTYRSVRYMIQKGIAGAHIEDTLNPKHLGLGSNTPPEQLYGLARLVSIEEMNVRIMAAVDARAKEGRDFVIIARCDALFNAGTNKAIDRKKAIESVIARGNAYAKAGADVFMSWGMSVDEVDMIAKAVPIPLCDGSQELKPIRKTNLKLYLALRTPLASVFEAMMRNLKERDDQEHASFNLPKPTFRMKDEYTDIQEYQKLGVAWANARSKMCNYSQI